MPAPNYNEAIAYAQQCLELHPPPTCQLRAQLVLAFSHARLNQVAEARSELERCSNVIEARFASHLGVGSYEFGLGKDWLIDRILLREAEALMYLLPISSSDQVPTGSALNSDKR